MKLESVQAALPEYAKDLKLNLSSLAREDKLDDQKKWGTFLASAYALGASSLLAPFEKAAQDVLSREAIEGAKTAAAMMGMTNIYYRFTHLVGHGDYTSLPAGLRMNAIARPGVEKLDFELWCLAVSAINGCGQCVASHEANLRKAGMSPEAIQTAIKIASVVHAVGRVLDAETSAG